MTTEELRTSPTEPENLTGPLRALWCDANGQWEEAHRCVQEDTSTEGAWVHAYLHRKEGNSTNAAHWYATADKPVCQGTLEEEWDEIARALL